MEINLKSQSSQGAIVVFGATSGIASAVVRELLTRSKNSQIILVGRSASALTELSTSLEKQFEVSLKTIIWDVLDFDNHSKHFQKLISEHKLAGLFFAIGMQFSQAECDIDPIKLALTISTNFTGPTIIIGLFAEYFKTQKSGWISCISSVAGDRGRGKVLAYAAAKAGLSSYLDGLRHRLEGSGVWVQTIKPGWVKTRMTENMHGPLIASPEKVAKEIVSALEAKSRVVYTPFFWKYIMLVIKLMPYPIFKRLKF